MTRYTHSSNISLDGQWDLCGFDYGTSDYDRMIAEEKWMPCVVPGDIHNALIENKVIQNPLIAENFEKYLWTEEKEWWYRKTFRMDQTVSSQKHYQLVFEGLDINARIYLNHQLIGSHSNAFTPFSADVTSLLVQGDNLVCVKIDCGLNSLSSFEKVERYDHGVPLSYDQDFRRIFLRKPQYCFRWDWGQRLVTCGIWRDVELREIDIASIDNIYIYDEFNADGSVSIHAEAESTIYDTNTSLAVRFSISDGITTEALTVPFDKCTSGTDTTIRLKKDILSPRFWWPNGFGEPNLYRVVLELLCADTVICSAKINHGIRKVGLCEDFISVEEGKSFTITINGEKIFCKGANWIPADAIPANVTKEKYESLIRQAAEANFNMLRIWGGGIYEDRVFFELCAKYGIMVWQDFIFANAFYPDDNADFVEQLEQEFTYIFKEYRNESAIVLWCGNNEINWTHPRAFGKVTESHGESIYSEMLPAFYKKYDDRRIYRVSSPFGDAGTGDQNSPLEGDGHSWKFWLNDDREIASDYKQFYTEKTKFCCEYGVMSYPNMDSVKRYIGSEEPDIHSEVWKMHDNFYENGNIARVLARYYVDPEGLSLEKLIEFSQFMQGDIYRKSIEHFRRRKFVCSGVVFWMYNDCWGTSGWTIVDYYLKEKASYGMVRDAYSPVLLSCGISDGEILFHALNDSRTEYSNCKATLSIRRFDGALEWSKAVEFTLTPNSNHSLLTVPIHDIDINNSYLSMEIADAHGQILYENIDFIADYKDLNIPEASLEYSVMQTPESLVVEFETDSLAVGLRLDFDQDICIKGNFCNLQKGRKAKMHIDKGSHSSVILSATCLNSSKRLSIVV